MSRLPIRLTEGHGTIRCIALCDERSPCRHAQRNGQIFQRHARVNLAGQIRNMNKTASCAPECCLRGQLVHQSVENMVAAKRACGLRYLRRNALALQGPQHGLDRQRAEISGWRARNNRLIDRLCLGVVGNPRIVNIDSDAFQRQGGASAGWPTQITSDGLCKRITRASSINDASNTVGSLVATAAWLATRLPCKGWTASQLGLMLSPPKASNPVSRTRGRADDAE